MKRHAAFAAHRVSDVPNDCLRRKVGHDAHVAWLYAQNLLPLADATDVAAQPALSDALAASACAPLAVVHPICLLVRVRNEHHLAQRPSRRVPTALPSRSRKAVAGRIKGARAPRP